MGDYLVVLLFCLMVSIFIAAAIGWVLFILERVVELFQGEDQEIKLK